MWMLPGLVFICLSGLHQALLQSQKKYFVPSVLPVVFNGVWIFAAFVSGGMKTLAIWVTLGAGVQWAVSSWRVKREFIRVERGRGFSFSWRELAAPMTFGLVGTAAVQINSAFDAVFARLADLSGPAYLWYAIRVQQLPLALFGLALSGALLPPLSRAFQEGDDGRFYAFLRESLRRGAMLIIPSTFGMFALGGVGINFLYGRGHFGLIEVEQTAQCLWAYAAGLIPAVLVLILSQGYYAKKLYWLAARASLISVLANILLNSLFVLGFNLGAVSVAIATSVSSFLNAYLLVKKLPESVNREIIWLSGRLTLASLTAMLATLGFQAVSFDGLAAGGWEKGGQLATATALYLAAFSGAAWLLRLSEIWEILRSKGQPQTKKSEIA
ncbi:MAG: polysaccharide biosynthesis C-terminal domain-containing protein [Chlamydiae bacterium]|nr:polysaccharide biosynthesis C-terminal domain-containing protein [Chlamydiota bacterium]